MTQREAIAKLIDQIEKSEFVDEIGFKATMNTAFLELKAVLARDDELTLEEVRLLLIKDDDRAGFHQEVVIRANSFALNKIVDGHQLYEDLVIPPHNADGSIPENGHKDIPEGQAPSMDGLRTMLDR